MLVCDRCGGNYPEENARNENDLPVPELFIVCPMCRPKYPWSLLKACCDPFSYALGLRDGTIIEFHEAEIMGEWVRIEGVADQHGDCPFDDEVYGYKFPRGLDVRFEDIRWCADAPYGS